MRKVFVPKSYEQLWDIWEKYPDAQVYAGGTDFFFEMHIGERNPLVMICLERIKELNGIELKGNNIIIGSGTTFSTMLTNSILQTYFPIIISTISRIGSPLIRNMATIGGNICTASPIGDTLPPLYILDTNLEICSKNNIRYIFLKDFIKESGIIDLKPKEILSKLIIKIPEEYNIHHFEKIGKRKALACTIVSIAALLKKEKGIITAARIAWGGVGPTVIRDKSIEQCLRNSGWNINSLKEAANQAEQILSPINDVRAGANYRKKVAMNLIYRFMQYV